MSNNTEIKRMNFFTGFFTTAADWTQEQQYHLSRRKLHNRRLHTPGVMRGEKSELKVIKKDSNSALEITVLPGAALDDQGNEIYLAEERVLTIDPTQYQLPQPVYVAIYHYEEKTDYADNVQDPEYSGYTRWTEIPRLEITPTPLDNLSCLELARIDLQPNVSAITEPEDPASPGGNQIDRRYVRWAGAVNPVEQQWLEALRERLLRLYHDQLEKRQRHNRRLHTPGIMRAEAEELRVEATGNLDVRVQPGAALDGAGNDIWLEQDRVLTITPPAEEEPETVFIAIRYENGLLDYFENLDQPAGPVDIPRLRVTDAEPDNQEWLELARIHLQPDVEVIFDADDPDNPQENQIDRRHVLWAGSVGVVESWLSPIEQSGLIQLMQDKRRDFAALAQRFPVPAAADVRHAAINLEMLARAGCLRVEQLPDALAAIALIEQDVGQEIGATYPAVPAVSEFDAYQAAVAALLTAIQDGLALTELLVRQGAVAEAARELSEVVLRPPEANAGPHRTVTTADETTTVTLDAADSEAFGEQTIVQYRWDEG